MTKRTSTSGLLLAAILAMGGCASNGEIKTITDPFNGTQRGFTLYLDAGHYTAVSINEAKGDYALDVLLVQQGVADLTGKPGDKGEFLVGAEKFEMPSATEAKPVSNANPYAVFTQWMIRYKMTRDEAARFAKGPFKAFKVAVGPQTFQMELSDSQARKVMDNMIILTAPGPAQ